MYIYDIVSAELFSEIRLPECFDDFLLSENAEPERTVPEAAVLVTVRQKPDSEENAASYPHRGFTVSELSDGSWLYEADDGTALLCDSEYRRLKLFRADGACDDSISEVLRLALECRLTLSGGVALHCACVEKDGFAVAFSGKSGLGKSTRAGNWVDCLGARWISGDRPAILPAQKVAFGAPWDGKEKIHKNISAPLAAVFEVRRAPFTTVRKLSERQAFGFLTSQCFVPMWDSTAAAFALANLRALTKNIPVYRLFCDMDEKAARETYNFIFHENEKILKEERDVKLKDGFVLRGIAGEHLLMPTGENITKYSGSVALNEVSAFIVEKLKEPLSKDDLLEFILAEYDVDRETAKKDLDALLAKLREYELLDEE